MAKYVVSYSTTAWYSVEVEANSKQEAREIGDLQMENTNNNDWDLNTDIDREVVLQEVEEEEAA